MSDFKPDFGLWAKQNFPTEDSLVLLNVSFNNITRINHREYSIFASCSHQGMEFALSIDFAYELLQPLLVSISTHFSQEDCLVMFDQLTDPMLRYRKIEWDKPIDGIGCSAEFGTIQHNKNESYLPFIVQEFF